MTEQRTERLRPVVSGPRVVQAVLMTALLYALGGIFAVLAAVAILALVLVVGRLRR